MLDVNLKNLVGRLNATCAETLREAARLCVARTHYDVDVPHLLLALLAREDCDLPAVFKQFDVSRATVGQEIEKWLRGLKTGNTSTPRFSPHLVRWVQSAWMVASVEYAAPSIRTSHLLIALLSDEDFVHRAREMAPSLKEIKVDELKDLLERIVKSSPEELGSSAETGASSAAGTTPAPAGIAGSGGAKALDLYTADWTALARSGKFDNITGRDSEIRQLVDVLLRRKKNNPILVGEAGVGKTAVVEGLAQRIAKGDVPDPLKNVSVRNLDLTLLQAGAGVKGEFENRLKEVIKEVKSSPSPIILFIDEAHTLIGAGGQAGQGDAANLLKPALARGELRTIAATTYAEYKKYFEKDAALERRFQPVHVGEPAVPVAIRMMRELADVLERHHGVRILDEAVRSAVELSERYISGRQLPDKSVDLLDTACARVALARASIPEVLETEVRNLEALDREIATLEREHAVGDTNHEEKLEELKAERERTRKERDEIQRRHEAAKTILDRLVPARVLLEARVAKNEPPRDIPKDLMELSDDALRSEIASLKARLAETQGEDSLMWACVDSDVVAQVISSWTGIPAGRMLTDEIVAIQNLHESLEKRVVGQSHALEEIVKRIQASRAGLEDPNKPIGVFLCTGPSGVGKTETALALADILYGGERNLISVNMSEYQEAHSVSGLKGSPKGYVGYGEGGALTEPVRQRPYSVVLLDEVEKAHSDVMEVFYQVFDKGMLEDTTGRLVNFRNTVIMMCSNLGGDEVIQAVMKADGNVPDAEQLREIVMPRVRKHFPAAFLGRVIVLPFGPLPDEVMEKVTRLKLGKVSRRMSEEHGTELSFDDSVVRAIVDRCVEVESGARNVDHIITNTVLPDLGRKVLGWMAEQDLPERIAVTVAADGTFSYVRDGDKPSAPAQVAGASGGGSERAPGGGRLGA